MKYLDEENVPMQAESESPHVDKMRKYVDLERSIERGQRDTHEIAKAIAEMQAEQNKLRRSLDSYLNSDRVEAAEVDR